MVTEYRRADSPSSEELMTHLSDCAAFTDAALPASPVVISDPDRLRALYATGLLDSEPEEHYDRITRSAAVALDAALRGGVIGGRRPTILQEHGGVGPRDSRAAPDAARCAYSIRGRERGRPVTCRCSVISQASPPSTHLTIRQIRRREGLVRSVTRRCLGVSSLAVADWKSAHRARVR
jgi:hypothetical protein